MRRRSPKLSIAVHEGCNVVAIRGDVDEITARRLGAAIVDGNEGRPVIIDLGQASSLSSGAVRGLLRRRTTPTAVVCAPGNVSRLLAMTPIAGYVPVCDDLAAAVAILKAVQIDWK
jgi:hypothetical protein